VRTWNSRPATVVRRSGFTVIELVVVVIIIGIVTAIAIPKLRVERAHVDGAVRTMNMALMVAQRDAVSRGHNVLVVFDTVHHTVRTVWDVNNNLQADVGEHSRPFALPERVVWGRGAGVPAYGTATAILPSLRNVGGLPMIVVQRNGGTDRATTIYLTSKRAQAGVGPDKDTRALVLDRATARPAWYVYAAAGWRRN
jgi:prepilin-type N-terminal cleavage/methylation domain-containing protein